MPRPIFASRYDYDTIAVPEVSFPQDDPKSRSITNQSDKDSADINKIMARYEKTGLITDELTGNQRQPVYGDFSGVGDFHQMQITIAKVTEAFLALPADTRNRFQNDPHNLIQWLENPANDAEAVKLGLKNPSRQAAPAPPVWDSKRLKWTDPKDGSVLPVQPPAPAAPGQDQSA